MALEPLGVADGDVAVQLQMPGHAVIVADSDALAQGPQGNPLPLQMEGTMRRSGLRFYARCELQMKRKGGAEDGWLGSRKGGAGGGRRGGGAGQGDDTEQERNKRRGFLTLLASRQKSTSYR